MYYPYQQQITGQHRRVMTVTGNGELLITPDTAQIQLEVSTENVNLSHAQQENAYLMNQVIDALLKVGINNEDIKTVSYSVFPQYDYIDGKQVFRTYQVTNAINLTISNIEQVGNVIDVAVQNGANNVSNIRFTLENEQIYYRQALDLALKDAVSKAQSIAATMQLRLDTTPIKIVEDQRGQTVMYRSVTASEMKSTTPIEPGQISVKASVNVQYQY